MSTTYGLLSFTEAAVHLWSMTLFDKKNVDDIT
jgi:hypothetical protein